MNATPRLCALVAVLGLGAAGGCKKSAPAAGPGSGSAPGSAAVVVAPPPIDAAPAPPPAVDAAPAAPVCFPADLQGRVDAFVADAHGATVCATSEAKVSKCISIDMTSGKATDAARPPAPAPRPSGGYTVTDDATQVAVCKNATCTKLALAPFPAPTDGAPAQSHGVAVAPNGTVAVAPLSEADHGKGLALFDTSSGRRMKIIDPGEESYTCAEPGRFLGDVIYSVMNVCAGPGARGKLFGLDGAPLGSLAAEYNVEGGDPIQLDGTTWAVPTFGGGGALVFDVKSGRALRGIQNIGDGFHLCDGCMPLGAADSWTVSPLVKTADGKLIELSATGGLSLIDPGTGKATATQPLPVCAPAPAPAGSGSGSGL